MFPSFFRVVTILWESSVCFYENIYTEKTVGGFRLWIRCYNENSYYIDYEKYRGQHFLMGIGEKLDCVAHQVYYDF